MKNGKVYTCASACFFIFVGGIYRSADDHGPPILGVHSPTLSQSDLTKLTPDQVNAANEQTQKYIAGYFKVMDVPAKYAEEIGSVPKNRIRWIRNDEFAADFAGFIPGLTALIKVKCADRPDRPGQGNAKPDPKIHSEHDCASEIRDELAVRALSDAVKGQSGDSSQSIFKIAPQGRPN